MTEVDSGFTTKSAPIRFSVVVLVGGVLISNDTRSLEFKSDVLSNIFLLLMSLNGIIEFKWSENVAIKEKEKFSYSPHEPMPELYIELPMNATKRPEP
jgi:hypothetical protein